ncbi:MAG TPA: S41 family peptidase [Chitinophagaceae bacterium]|nr:S41 family peptidase [Chitinophagaceae bacterium]
MPLNPQTGYAFEYNGTKKTPRYSFITDVPVSVSSAMGGTPAEMPYGADSVWELGSKKAAYLLLRSFPRLSDCQQWLDNVFDDFAGQNMEDLVIDLRDNTGGYVATVQYLADLIAAVSMNGKKMYSEAYNPFMQEGKAFLLRQQLYLDERGNTVNYNGRLATLADVDYSEAGNTYLFSKKGNLNSLKKLYFLVSGTTASAAEMLISVLKPWFSVQLIGQKTYGKPVGFFAVKIDAYSLYLSSFLIKNADGWHDYFNGMTPDIALVNMDSALDTALRLIDPSTAPEMNRAIAPKVSTLTIKDPGSRLKNVLIESRWKLKK